MTEKFWYAIAMTKKKGSLHGQIFKTRIEAKMFLPLYRKSGFVGGIVKVKPPTPLSKEEKVDLEKTNKFLNGLTRLLK